MDMAGSSGDEHEQITGRVNRSTDAKTSVRYDEQLLDFDDIVDRRNEVAHMEAAYYRLTVATLDSPIDQMSDCTARAKIGTGDQGYALNVSGRQFLQEETDSFDPVCPVLVATGFAGESDFTGPAAGPASAGAGSGDHSNPDQFRFESQTDKLIVATDFDARDEINARLSIELSEDRGFEGSFLVSLSYMMAFSLRPA